MSGPVDDDGAAGSALGVPAIEVKEGRSTSIGRVGIVRVLPTKARRTVGPWCFCDLMKPDDIEQPPPIEIGPHPHIGLATVTWLFGGEILHTDSLGSEQLIRPGQLNLMTAGRGVGHAELGVETRAGVGADGIMGAQLWLAQTDATRNGNPRFEHLEDLPRVDLGAGQASVLVGGIGGNRSVAEVDHPAVALDVTLAGELQLAVDPSFEHGVVPIDRPLKVEDAICEPGSVAFIPPGYDVVRIESRDGSGRLLILGGEPFGSPIKMWWNFVARDLDEITDAWRAWQAHDEDRFGPVPSSLTRIDAPRPPWLRQK